jgi:hypothetical protein
VLVVLLLIAVAVPLLYYRKSIAQRGRLLYWQRKCLRYTAAPDQVVYEEDQYKPSPLLKRPGYDGWPVPLPPNAGAPNRPLPRAVATLSAPPVAPYLTAAGLPPVWLVPPRGATVFLHERISKSGHRRLVLITRPPAHDRPFMYAFGLQPLVITLAGLTGGVRHHIPPPVAYSWLDDLTRPPTAGLRFYAVQPDPDDAARFTIRYDLSGGSGEIEGRLKDDGSTVSLRITSGPAIGTKWETAVLFKN